MFNGGLEAGASQFVGGGFMPSPGAQAGGGSAQKKSYDQTVQSVRKVTIKQLHQALEQSAADNVKVDGKEISNVSPHLPGPLKQQLGSNQNLVFTNSSLFYMPQLSLVAKVISVREDNVTFNMVLDDGTGRITSKMFLSNDGAQDLEAQRRAELREGIYVRVFGHLSVYNNERQINTFHARPIKDFNEVTYHLSQIIFQHMHIAAGGDTATAPGAQPKFEGAAAPAAAAAAAAFVAPGGMSPIQGEVLAIFNAPDAASIDAGLTIADVIARSNNRFNQQQVSAAINYLVDEGHLYSTIDDAHWKSCSC